MEVPKLELFVPEVKMMAFFCKACQEVKMMPSRRGRPPESCQECQGNGLVDDYEATRLERERAAANARCDRLDMMLKSRGTHISQNRNGKYDR